MSCLAARKQHHLSVWDLKVSVLKGRYIFEGQLRELCFPILNNGLIVQHTDIKDRVGTEEQQLREQATPRACSTNVEKGRRFRPVLGCGLHCPSLVHLLCCLSVI